MLRVFQPIGLASNIAFYLGAIRQNGRIPPKSVLKGQGVGRSPKLFDSASEAAVSWCPSGTKSNTSIIGAAKTLVNDGAKFLPRLNVRGLTGCGNRRCNCPTYGR